MGEMAKKIRVSGLVQGVGFRFYTQREAEKLGLSGYAHNLPDGRVEVVAEGEAGQVQRLVDWLKVGPSSALVEDIEVEEVAPGHHRGFETG
ncbi:acylphosphatase [Zobellella endophytica]|mgnify:CR=1 FL=1|uniref:acylphosphatase n=1 Tax=Zobellella endophytica TaxID=2116700 RepID=A0A2P7RC40_9GAMM|nr:acylphosphatase [Zobellella endophytica]PSJ47781.1 acylphosphatase [Zobellella endophytica]